MFKIKIADTVVEIDNIYQFIKAICKDYLYDGDECDFCVSCTHEMIEEEIARLSEEHPRDPAYVENICVYRQIALKLLDYNAFVMHAATIGVDDKGYAFTAKSGTGKSTHIAFWKRLLGDKVYIINGDKPIMKVVDDKVYVYGSPWCGKEFWHDNVRAELNGICFLERGATNSIEKQSLEESAAKIMKQILITNNENDVIKTFDLVDKMLRMVKTWKLKCTASIEAAQIAYDAMHGGKYED